MEESGEALQDVKKPEMDAKQALWDSKVEEFKGVEDRLGMGIDEGILEGVVAANLLGLNTTQSCEGHYDPSIEGGRYNFLPPYLEISDPDYPFSDIYLGQLEEIKKLAIEHGINEADIINRRTREGLNLLREAVSRTCVNGESESYKIWKNKTDKFKPKISDLLDEFYSEQPNDVDRGLILDDDESLRIVNREYYELLKINNSLKDYSEEELKAKMNALKEEMSKFSSFLKNKFFSADNGELLKQPAEKPA